MSHEHMQKHCLRGIAVTGVLWDCLDGEELGRDLIEKMQKQSKEIIDWL